MSVISASDVKKLRDSTGAGMMDSKKALSEANGDFDKAVEILRKKGQKLSIKRADREAKEGVVLAKINNEATTGIVIRLSCETDFVAKNEGFVEMTDKIAQIALDTNPSSIEELLEKQYDKGLSINDKIIEQVGVIGEKISLSAYEKISSPLVVSYVHMGNKAGVVLGLSKAGSGEIEEAGRNVAMQVAAMKPIALDKDGVDQSVVDKEIEIGKEQAKAEGKPENIIEKIAIGKLNKFFAENTLVNQSYVKDNSMTVANYLKSVDSELVATGFKHIALA